MAKNTTPKTTKPTPETAQKPAAASAQLVHIESAGPGKSPLSKAQQAFNQYTKKIVRLETDLHDYREATTTLRQLMQSEYRPLQTRHNDARAAMMRLLDRTYQTQKLTKSEKKKVKALLVSNCYNLIERGYHDLKPIFARYEQQDFEEASEQADAEAAELMKQVFATKFGIEFDPDADVSTQEKFRAYVAGRVAEMRAEEAAGQQQTAERRARRRKSPKQQAAADKQAAEEKSTTKAVRSLYMDLVKYLHPDREPDPAEAARKTELLKRVTSAYQANELLTLLRLQLELQRTDHAHLGNLAEDQLGYYNKLLQEQAKELEQGLLDEQTQWSNFTGRPLSHSSSPSTMRQDYDRRKAALNQKIRQLEAEVLAFAHDPAAIRTFLREYNIPTPAATPLMRF